MVPQALSAFIITNLMSKISLKLVLQIKLQSSQTYQPLIFFIINNRKMLIYVQKIEKDIIKLQ